MTYLQPRKSMARIFESYPIDIKRPVHFHKFGLQFEVIKNAQSGV